LKALESEIEQEGEEHGPKTAFWIPAGSHRSFPPLGGIPKVLQACVVP